MKDKKCFNLIVVSVAMAIIIGFILYIYIIVLNKPKMYDFHVKNITLFEFKGKNVVNWANKYDKNDPPKLTIYINHCTYGEEPKIINDKKTINDTFDALSKIRLTGRKNNISSTQTTITYLFTNDEDSVSFSFQDNKIPENDGQYYIKGNENLSEIEIDYKGDNYNE